jgi:hypothetical protein
MATFLVIGGIVLAVGAYLALDWWLAGRKGKRAFARARDGQIGNSRVDQAMIERQIQATQQQTGTNI